MLGKAQKIIVIIAIILMILCFSMLIWSFMYVKDEAWPPIAQPCPDYWKISNDGNCSSETTSCSTKSVNFSSFTPCNKYMWTTGESVNGIPGCTGTLWDGISYGYGEHDACYVPV